MARPGTAGISQSLLPSTVPSPQQLLLLCLPSFLQLQLLLNDLLHPGCIRLGSLPPDQFHPLQLIFLLQECLQDPPISRLDEGVEPVGGCGLWVGWSEPWHSKVSPPSHTAPSPPSHVGSDTFSGQTGRGWSASDNHAIRFRHCTGAEACQ